MPARTVLLLGVGHANAHVVRMWRRSPPPGARLVCVSDFPTATYSGMLPGMLARQYEAGANEIDLRRLCAAAGAKLLLGEASGLDLDRRVATLRDGEKIAFDVVSIGVGSAPRLDVLRQRGAALLSIKPMQTFADRLARRVDYLRVAAPGRPWRISIVGGGAAGVEIALCLQKRLHDEGRRNDLFTLVDSGKALLRDLPPRVAEKITKLLGQRDVQVSLGRRVTAVSDDELTLDDGQSAPVDMVVWTTGAAAPRVLDKIDLPKDEAEFLKIGPTLQSTGDKSVFAVGDCASFESAPLAKAGVYAVRQGPLLWRNMVRHLSDRPLLPFRPQGTFLKLLNTGDGRALLVYRGAFFHGRWCWRLKDAIDRAFLAKYQR